MRKTILYSALFVILLSVANTSSAQTTLALGDIAFTGFNVDAAGDGGDHFSFVILRTGGIAAGTTIRFTDRGWTGQPGAACGTNSWSATAEGDILWTATTALAYGAQVRISSVGTASTGTITQVTAFSFAAGGDQIFAIQNSPQPGANINGAHVMLAGLHMNEEVSTTSATNWDNQAAPTTSQSNKPACIVNGTHGLFINPEVDNARIKPSVVLSGNPATDRSRINNAANWDVDDATPFTLPGPLSGLPVDFTWIKAAQKGSAVSVEWGVGEEDQILHYTIERSFDGRLFTEVGTIQAAGRRTYSWSDLKPMDGNNYYRIRATEMSAAEKYSTIAIVNLGKGSKGIGVYPNIVRSGQFNLQITNLPAGNYKLNVHSGTGQLVYSRTINHTGGSATQSINLPSAMPKGIYRLNMFTTAENAVATIVVE